MALRAVRYLRVSRQDQDPRLQDDETKEFVSRRGWKLTDTYTDHGISGAKDRRPELDRLLGDARRKRFDVLLVWRSDRMFRSLKNMVNTLDDLTSLGIAFTSVTEPFDTTCPSGKLFMHIVSAMGEFERSILIERTRAGVAAARRRGVRVGRPRARLDDDHLRELRADGWSVRRIAESLGVGSSTIQRRLLVVVPEVTS
jgi:DNA invertase Pin-like site-specific DNA recombinase